jgi:ADP-ribose pyrophosphatase
MRELRMESTPVEIMMADTKKPKASKLDWEHIDSRYDAQAGLMLFEKRIDRLRNPRNEIVFDRLVLESLDWVNMVVLDGERRCVMIRQYRFGVGYTTLETPGGMVDPGEDSFTAAMRELREETGYVSDKWSYLGAVEPNPAFHNHLCHHWLAEDAYVEQHQDLGEGEMIAVELMTEDEVRAAVNGGELKHALALSALARVYQLWPLPFRQP